MDSMQHAAAERDRLALRRLRRLLDRWGIPSHQYGINEPVLDAWVIEPAPDDRGWQLRYWDANRGPGPPGRVHPHAVDAAKALLAELIWNDTRV